MAKQAVIHVSEELINLLIEKLLTGGTVEIEVKDRPLPDDVRVKGFRYAYDRGAYVVLLESKTFEDKELGELLPLLDPPVVSGI